MDRPQPNVHNFAQYSSLQDNIYILHNHLTITKLPETERHQRQVLAKLPLDPVGRGHQATPLPFSTLPGHFVNDDTAEELAER